MLSGAYYLLLYGKPSPRQVPDWLFLGQDFAVRTVSMEIRWIKNAVL